MTESTPRDQPPYQRIAAELGHRIEAGELRPGDRVPSTRQITRDWGVAMATATKALSTLRLRGMVRAEPGRGTVVVGPCRRSRAGPRRRPLTSDEGPTRERIVRAAIAIADAEGLGVLSMRRVATHLGVATMSLYRYLPGKDELVLGMCDTVFADQPLPAAAPEGWRARLELAGRTEWSIYRRHPWLARAISYTRPQPMPHGMAHTEWMLRALEGLGLRPVTMLHVVVALHGFVRGIAVNVESETLAEQDTGVTQRQWMDERAATFAEILRTFPMPVLARVTADPEVDVELDELFEFGLARLLDGLGALLDGR